MRSILFALVALVCVPCFAAEKIVQKNIQKRGLFGRRDVDISITKVRGNGDAQLNAALKAQAIRDAKLRAALKAQQLRQQQLNGHHGHIQSFRQNFRVVEYVPVAAIVEEHDCAVGQLRERATYSAPAQQQNDGCNLLGH